MTLLDRFHHFHTHIQGNPKPHCIYVICSGKTVECLEFHDLNHIKLFIKTIHPLNVFSIFSSHSDSCFNVTYSFVKIMSCGYRQGYLVGDLINVFTYIKDLGYKHCGSFFQSQLFHMRYKDTK